MDDYETMDTGVLCAICRSHAPPVPGNSLCYMGFAQPSRYVFLWIHRYMYLHRIPIIAKKQDVAKFNGQPRSNLLAVIDSCSQPAEELMPSFQLLESAQNSAFSSHGNIQHDAIEERDTTDSHFFAASAIKYYYMCNNIEETTGISIQCCGHCMHFDCFASFFASQPQNDFQQVNPALGEFLCPVCRRMANIALPIMKESQCFTSIPPAGPFEYTQVNKQFFDVIFLK
jgi:hypothetical protein